MIIKYLRRFISSNDIKSKTVKQYNYEDYIYDRNKKKPLGLPKKDRKIEKNLDFPLP